MHWRPRVGDEPALLFPETGPEAARTAMAKLQNDLLEEMRQAQWPITFSIGVSTCNHPTQTVDDLVKMADELMYSVEHGGKNASQFADCDGQP